MSDLVRFARAELRAAGLFHEDADYNGDVAVQVMALMETLCAYGHSGASQKATLDAFVRLAAHKPLTPLTGEDDEWPRVSTETHDGASIWRNLRDPSVFKNEDEQAFAPINGHIVPIKFPYLPFTE